MNVAFPEVLPSVLLVVSSAAEPEVLGVCRAAHGERIDVIDFDEVSSTTASPVLRGERALAVIA